MVNKKQRKKKKRIMLQNKALIKKYPWLIPRNWDGKIPNDYDYSYVEWFGWPSGWNKAFGKMYLDELGDAVKRSGFEKEFQVLQMKEKYGCYDKETEVLTKGGWKYFKDLSYEDDIATLGENNHLIYQKPEDIIAYHYEGKMYHLKNRGVDLCVTPNHNLYVSKGSYFNGAKNNEKRVYDFELCTPDKYFGKDKRFYKSCIWDGELNSNIYKIKGLEYDSPIKMNETSYMRHYIKDDLVFDMIPWLKFLGFYVAEGSASICGNQKHAGNIFIAFNPYTEYEFATKLVADIGYNPLYGDERHKAIYDATLGEWLRANCGHGAENKRVPNFIKNLPPKYIEIFLEYLFIGDGRQADTSNTLTTISKQLSNDVQELLIKCGYAFRERVRDRRGESSLRNLGKEITSKHVVYEINWLKNQYIEIDNSKVAKTKSFIEDWCDYKGPVYCVTVPNHIIYIRRNGKGVWCGNSCRCYVSPVNNEIDQIISKYERLSGNICINCGKPDTYMINDGWYSPWCYECWSRTYREREQCICREDYVPKTDEELSEMYNKCICDDGIMVSSYKVLTANGEKIYDISETAEKIRARWRARNGGKKN